MVEPGHKAAVLAKVERLFLAEFGKPESEDGFAARMAVILNIVGRILAVDYPSELHLNRAANIITRQIINGARLHIADMERSRQDANGPSPRQAH